MIGLPSLGEGRQLPPGDIERRKRAADQRAQRLAEEASIRACQMDLDRSAGLTTISLAGEFDASCVLRYERIFRQASEDSLELLVVDMGRVTFIDSTGLALLLRTEAASRQDGFELRIRRSPAAAVRSALEASGLERVLPFMDEDG